MGQDLLGGRDMNRQDILRAICEFDKNYRGKFSGKDDWASWIKDGRYRYAVYYRGRLYPAKFITHLATGRSRDDFSGGEETNDPLINLGFEIINLHDGDAVV